MTSDSTLTAFATRPATGQAWNAPGVDPAVSIAIFAWNEEATIHHTLNSLFRQSIFEDLSRRGLWCEIICVVNGCSDGTPAAAERVFSIERASHPFANTFKARVENLCERGKLNAWNQFVHRLSSRGAAFLVMMDADIIMHEARTIENMARTLEENPTANISTDLPRKDIHFKEKKSLRERLSLVEAKITATAAAQLCGQLYCIRSEIARRIYLPKDLAACEDGFIKSLVCTDFLSRAPIAQRICLAPEAEHTFEAYVSPSALLRNQKRQMMGQTMVHLLIDQFLPTLSERQLSHLSETLRAKDEAEPGWLKQLVARHLVRTRFFWRLYPNLLGQRLERWNKLKGLGRLLSAPQVAAVSALSLVPAFLAHRSLKRGATDYWPRADRSGLGTLAAQTPASLAFSTTTHNPK
jgi:glycosyltransferase involved in cell wall biosynthesis